MLCGKYRLCSVLGAGGFGITYEGIALAEEKTVAIKEFFPADYAIREHADTEPELTIYEDEKETFDRELKRFLNEAETLREFRYLDGIVTVLDCFEENGTAYIVMEYIESVTMRQYVKYNGCLQYQELIELLAPVIQAMIQIHKRGILHRDISPDNLLFGLDNEVRLIDFGAVSAIGEMPEHTKTVILKKGYAPPEQYLAEGEQGPWTDVYAMAATLYMGLTGQRPVDSVARLQGEELPSDCLVEIGLEPWQRDAILKGMSLRSADRYKNLEELLDALTVPPSVEDELTHRQKELPGKIKTTILRINRRKKNWLAMAGILVLLMGIGCFFFYYGNKPGDRGSTFAASATADGGGRLYRMPDVTKMELKDAVAEIQKEDGEISIEMEEEYNENVPEGQVMSQSVAQGTQYSEGAIKTIVLTVSKGVKPAAKQPEDTKNSQTHTNAPTATPKGKETKSPGKTTAEPKATQSPTKTAAAPKATKSPTKPSPTKDIRVIEDDPEEYEEFSLGD